MIAKEKKPLNLTALSKKYKCDVNRLVRCWKKGETDFEIANSLGIDILTILQVRREITCICEKERQKTQKAHFSITPMKNPR